MTDEKKTPGSSVFSWAIPRTHSNFAAADDVSPTSFQLPEVERGQFVLEGDLHKPQENISATSGEPTNKEFNRGNLSFSADAYSNPWEQERAPGETRWTDSIWGRISTRLVSRGVLAAAGMTAGNILVRSYNPHQPYESMHVAHKVANRTIQAFDMTLGKAIKTVFGPEAVRFRAKRDYYTSEQLDYIYSKLNPSHVRQFAKPAEELFDKKFLKVLERDVEKKPWKVWEINGLSFGNEVWNLTVPFASASFADALGRSALAELDPNYKKDYIEDGHVKFGKLASHIGKKISTAFFYNQMEDWFAAPFYVYQMKAQRRFLGSAFPGAKQHFDQGNAAGHILDLNTGTLSTHGMLAGAIDLQARFMGYNFYTLLFRDIVSHGKNKYEEWKEKGFHPSLPDDPLSAGANAVSETGKYLAKSLIKSQLYMLPAVPFFWVFRVPQALSGSVILTKKENGPVAMRAYQPFDKGTTEFPKPYTDSLPQSKPYPLFSPDIATSTTISRYASDYLATASDPKNLEQITNLGGKGYRPLFVWGEQLNRGQVENWIKPASEGAIFDPYAHGRNAVERAWCKIGSVNASLSKSLHTNVGYKIFGELGNKDGAKIYDRDRARFLPKTIRPSLPTRDFVNNAIAYTPYMIAKDESSRWMDNEVMDASIYRTLDGITGLNWKSFSEGSRDIWHSVFHQPVSEETYKQSLQQRGLINSRQDIGRKDKAEQDALRQRAEEHTASHAHDADKPSTVIKTKEQEKEGWAPYEVARSSMTDKTIPPGATIH
ncbi:MAG: hypothetical protein U1E36_00680 [Rickettsiales bacterium]